MKNRLVGIKTWIIPIKNTWFPYICISLFSFSEIDSDDKLILSSDGAGANNGIGSSESSAVDAIGRCFDVSGATRAANWLLVLSSSSLISFGQRLTKHPIIELN